MEKSARIPKGKAIANARVPKGKAIASAPTAKAKPKAKPIAKAKAKAKTTATPSKLDANKKTATPLPPVVLVNTRKWGDTDPFISRGGKADEYWKRWGFDAIYKAFSKGRALPERLMNINFANEVVKQYQLRAVGFGNWLNEEDRYNYSAALYICLMNLAEVLGMTNNMGLSRTISFTFGARGAGRALAHFEPDTYIINLTRYKKQIVDPLTGRKLKVDKAKRFVATGGPGSLAHEYGHAIDYFAGEYIYGMGARLGVCGGRSTSTETLYKSATPGTAKFAVNEFFEAVHLNKDGSPSEYHLLVHKKAKNADYWYRRNEYFARCFEKWVGEECDRKGIANTFLHKQKYEDRWPYPEGAEWQRIKPKLEALVRILIRDIRARVK